MSCVLELRAAPGLTARATGRRKECWRSNQSKRSSFDFQITSIPVNLSSWPKTKNVAQLTPRVTVVASALRLPREPSSRCRVTLLCEEFPRMNRWLAALFSVTFGLGAEAAKVDFNRDIRPIMADTCFRCHGFDANARKARLRLDVRAEALKPAKSGAVPIVPGKPKESEVIRRLFTENEDDRMPPEEIHKPLKVEQKELFRRWTWVRRQPFTRR